MRAREREREKERKRGRGKNKATGCHNILTNTSWCFHFIGALLFLKPCKRTIQDFTCDLFLLVTGEMNPFSIPRERTGTNASVTSSIASNEGLFSQFQCSNVFENFPSLFRRTSVNQNKVRTFNKPACTLDDLSHVIKKQLSQAKIAVPVVS